MKKLFALVIAFATFSCTSNAQKTSFSETALSETLLATDGSQMVSRNRKT